MLIFNCSAIVINNGYYLYSRYKSFSWLLAAKNFSNYLQSSWIFIDIININIDNIKLDIQLIYTTRW